MDVDRAVRSILGRLVWSAGGGGRGAPGVQGAILSGCGHLTDRSLALLARNCPHLERLELQKCRDVGWPSQKKTKNSFLKKLQPRKNKYISPSSVAEVPGSNPASPTIILRHCKIIVCNTVKSQGRRGDLHPRPENKKNINIQFQ